LHQAHREVAKDSVLNFEDTELFPLAGKVGKKLSPVARQIKERLA
jgi:hypothetical protein